MIPSKLMSDSNASTPIASPEMKTVQSSSTLQNRCSSDSDGPLAILWDIENCPVPSDVRPEDVASNIRMALRVHPVINGAVVVFSAYGDFNAFPRRVREGCQRTGVKLIDVPNGRKDAADKAILVDMFLFALDNPPPSSIMLISGDVDFAPALHILGQRGYNVILVIPPRVVVNSALCSAGKFVWDWQSIVRGEGFVPSPSPSAPPRLGMSNVTEHLMGCQISDNNPEGMNEEAILYRGNSRNCYNPIDSSMVSQSLAEYATNTNRYPTASQSPSLASGVCEPSACLSSYDQLDSSMCVAAPGDINGLKGQLVMLLQLSGGCMPLLRVPSEYQKQFGKPLYISEYGVFKLVNLFKKMGDTISVDGKGNKRFVYLRNWKANPSTTPPFVLLRRDKKPEENTDVRAAASRGSSDEFSDEDRFAAEAAAAAAASGSGPAQSEASDRNLEEFKQELQEILVSYSCKLLLSCFEDIYRLRYKKPLDYQRLGVDNLEKLLDMVRDVVIVYEDPSTKRKFIEALY
ncbi:PREDICTED: uncharacterized protein LOC104804376 [Tarenaya hassleriana]|uniref:uncharacterized protein LOC104804376 n=1 Tax=Tarenaya hassleriana TaxID=28532 RepID=UPI00053C4EDD|nr:PREDICTED: uncharacterized protein LOC104804376 [Tarenaya hassleriana]XP_010526952.1 PREDICTED: uncharacterized protein LOC104804376 [Tarenaya hassleriana]